jgi:uncharacterized membrane protein YvbJ
MKMKKGYVDKDLGMKAILEELKKLGTMNAKVGIPEGAGEQDGVSIAQYAAWNEYGVAGKTKKWRIKPRAFLRFSIDNYFSEIKVTQEKLVKLVADGKLDAVTAAKRLGENQIALIKTSIKDGPWEANSDITINGLRQKDGRRYVKGKNGKPLIKGKKSSQPLIDTGTMRNSIQYIVEENGVERARGKKAQRH